MMQRRALLAFAPAVLAARRAAAAGPERARLMVEPSDRLRREAGLWLGNGRVFSCPPSRARLVAVFRLRARPGDGESEVAALGFAADTAEATQDMLALVGPQGTLLALEPLRVEGHEGATCSARVAMLPDRRHVVFERTAAWRDSGSHDMTLRRESWTDYLRWDEGGLHDAPPRPVLSGTRQAALSAWRATLRAMIPGACREVTPDLLAAIRTGSLAL